MSNSPFHNQPGVLPNLGAITAVELYQLLFESAAEGLVVVNREGVIKVTNPSANSMFGYEDRELIDQMVEVLVPGKFHHKHAKHRENYQHNPTKRAMGTGMELTGVRKDGSQFPVEISLNHFQADDELLVMALITDITERKIMVDALKNNENRLNSIIQTIGVVLVQLDKEANILEWNKKAEEIFGLKRQKAIGRNFREDILPDVLREDVSRVIDTVLKGTPVLGFDSEVLNPRGEIKSLLWNSEPLFNDKGEVTGIIACAQDITDRIEVQTELEALNIELEERVEERTKALEESQQLYSAIAENFPNGTINVFDKSLNYVFVEGKELEENGISSKDLIGTNYLQRLSTDVRSSIKRRLNRVFEGINTQYEIHRDNKVYSINAVGLHDHLGNPTQILMVEQNISQQKEAEQNMRRALQKEQLLNELKGRFVAMASHEFRTPLSTILSSVALLSRYSNDPEHEPKKLKHIERIKGSVHNLTTILNDFLSLDKLEDGKVEHNPVPLNLLDFCTETVDQMKQMAKETQQITYEHEGPVEVEMDPQLLKNVLHNLMSNAIKYSLDDGLIEVTTKNEEKHIILSIKDHGIGIPKLEQSNLFERFFRARNSVNIQGTGLGLNIVKKYVDLMQGNISFESEENKGTTFTVVFKK